MDITVILGAIMVAKNANIETKIANIEANIANIEANIANIEANIANIEVNIKFLLLLSIIIISLIAFQAWIIRWHTKSNRKELIHKFYEINNDNNQMYLKLRDEIINEIRYLESHLQKLKQSTNSKELELSQKRRNTHLNNQSNTNYNKNNFDLVNYHQEEPMENSQPKNDSKFDILLKAYQKSQVDEKFIPLLEVINNLVVDGFVNSEQEAQELIVNLTRKYPSSILIENVRGKLGKQIAIIW